MAGSLGLELKEDEAGEGFFVRRVLQGGPASSLVEVRVECARALMPVAVCALKRRQLRVAMRASRSVSLAAGELRRAF